MRSLSTLKAGSGASLALPVPALGGRFYGADDGIRTRDPNLGKVVLYQLSHVRVKARALV